MFRIGSHDALASLRNGFRDFVYFLIILFHLTALSEKDILKSKEKNKMYFVVKSRLFAQASFLNYNIISVIQAEIAE